MNKIKKIIVVTVTVFICASIGIFIMCNINKNENTIIKKNFGSLMSEVLNNSEVYGLYNVDFTNIEILNEVIINDVESEKRKPSNVVNLPVIVNGEIELVFTISKTFCNYNVSLGKDFAPLLSEMKKNDLNEIYIIQDNYTFYAVSGNYIYKQVGQTVTQIDEQELNFSIQEDMQISKLNSVNNDYTQTAIESLEAENNPRKPEQGSFRLSSNKKNQRSSCFWQRC